MYRLTIDSIDIATFNRCSDAVQTAYAYAKTFTHSYVVITDDLLNTWVVRSDGTVE